MSPSVHWRLGRPFRDLAPAVRDAVGGVIVVTAELTVYRFPSPARWFHTSNLTDSPWLPPHCADFLRLDTIDVATPCGLRLNMESPTFTPRSSTPVLAMFLGDELADVRSHPVLAALVEMGARAGWVAEGHPVWGCGALYCPRPRRDVS